MRLLMIEAVSAKLRTIQRRCSPKRRCRAIRQPAR
jgi:hypothetical protein